MSEIQFTAAEWAEFESIVDTNLNQGLWKFEKELRAFVNLVGWTWMPLSDKHRFRLWAKIINKSASRLSYNTLRRNQLRKAGSNFFVMGGYDPAYCPAEHSELLGITLPPDHPFWKEYLPPNDWDCTCRVSGARSERSAERMRGQLDKPLPYWWRENRGIKPHFRANHLPDLREVVELLHSGSFDR